MIKRLLYYLGLVELVWTLDMDGDCRLRMVWHRDGRRYAYAICGPCTDGSLSELLPDMRCAGGRNGYMRRWVPYTAGRPQKPHVPHYTMWKPR